MGVILGVCFVIAYGIIIIAHVFEIDSLTKRVRRLEGKMKEKDNGTGR